MLYYAWGHYYKKYKQILFKEDIEAWPLGPVVRDVYVKYCENEDRNIKIDERDINDAKEKLNTNTKQFLNDFYHAYKHYRTSAMVETSHQEKPWRETFNRGDKKVISVELLKDFFKDLH